MNTLGMVKNRNLNIRTSQAEYAAIKQLAAFHGKTMSAFVLDSVLEKLEDWEDMKAIQDYERNPNPKTYPLKEVMEELELR